MRALFGGSFNPVHNGHLILARDILEDFSLEEVIFVPAMVQPLKGELLIPAEVRLKALEAAISLQEGFSLWTYEIEKGGVSYTYDTLKEYHRLYKERPFFIMGADSFATFHLWKNPKGILELSRLIVALRPNAELDFRKVLSKVKPKARVLEVEKGKVDLKSLADVIIYRGRLLDISSTEIRQRLREGKSVSYFLPESSLKVIRRWRDALQEDV
ncbi:nicotinate (nicotinamide) nucleotide adenylyltransferase [Thermovibrio sp.]